MSLIVAGFTFALQELVVPAASYRATLTLDRALKREKPIFQDRNIIYTEFRKPEKGGDETLARFFYAEQFDGQRMKGLTIIDRSTPGRQSNRFFRISYLESLRKYLGFFQRNRLYSCS